MGEPLTHLAIQNAKPKGTRYAITDAGHPGLRVIVYPSGEKAFAFRYARPGAADGRKKDVLMVLGPAAGSGALKLAQAREMASAARRQIVLGGDPSDSRRQERAALAARIDAERREAVRRDNLVEVALDRYFRLRVDGMRSAYELKRLLSVELAPWSGRRIDGIERFDAIKLLDEIAERGHKVTANRVRTKAKTFFSWCRSKGLVEANPFDGTEPAVAEVSRQRFLSDDELRYLIVAIGEQPPIWSAFFRLLLLTGQRRNEVAGMRWPEIGVDEAGAIWTIPAARTKNKREHIVPLSHQALAIIRAQPRIKIMDKTGRLVDAEPVLTTNGVVGLGGFSKAKARLDTAMRAAAGDAVNIAQWQLHDWRRSMATVMGKMRVDIAVTEMCLNHVSGTMAGVTGIYQRYDYPAERRAAMCMWADYLDRLVEAHEADALRSQEEA